MAQKSFAIGEAISAISAVNKPLKSALYLVSTWLEMLSTKLTNRIDPLSDTNIIVYGVGVPTNTCFSQLVQQLRALPLKHGRYNFEFQYCSRRQKRGNNNAEAYRIKHGKVITKLISNWQTSFVSKTPMQTHEYYFEIEMMNAMSESSGVYIGVTTDPQQLNFGGNLDEFTTCAIYNTNIFAKKFVHACKAATMKAGHIIGVVVDRTEDKFLFFINGVLVAIGEKKPSEFESALYAFVNVFYAEQTIAVCEKYSLRDLKANLH